MRMDLTQAVRPADFPLEHLLENGGYCSIFRRIGCIGDSLSSGEFESDNSTAHRWHDYYEYSWGQFLARMTGAEVRNFSMGGMSARTYCESFASQYGYWDRTLACQAYILALGVNDLYSGAFSLGSLEDICMEDWKQNKDSFAGWFGKILQRYRQTEPNACFFLVTIPQETDITPEKNSLADGHAALMHQLAERFENTYVIDLREYGPVYDDAFKEKFYLRGHMNPAGYYLTAQMIATYIDHIIRSHFPEFAQTGFIGTPYYKKGYHWEAGVI